MDNTKLTELIVQYKNDFFNRIKEELYKWKAVKCFKDNWDIDAEDFPLMLKQSLSKTGNLLAFMNNYPRRMINNYAVSYPEEVRFLFKNLYDESQDLVTRIESFKKGIESVHSKWDTDGNKNHFHTDNVISTYLWLCFPDKYYIYKPSVAKNIFRELNGQELFAKKAEAVVVAYRLYDEISEVLLRDSDLQYMLKSVMTSDCYPDYYMKTATIDFVYSINKPARFSIAGKHEADKVFNVKNHKVMKPLPVVVSLEKYGKSDFLNEVFMDEKDYDRLSHQLMLKKNVILQGAPGVGKTFIARRLAYSVMGIKDDSRICFVQFHQSYSYEDFIMGYRPVEDMFILRKGIFYDFCTLAKNNRNKDYFFIIDEINRGNLSKIFGELLMLIEKDYRGEKNKMTLAYTGEKFYVPENLYIIGMMNTADRSLAMIDYALRRRFSFFNIKPGFETEGFRKKCSSVTNPKFDKLVRKIIELNKKIIEDDSLGSGFEIGHSHLCFKNPLDVTDDFLRGVVEYDIIPMLEEYWFDNKNKVSEWSEKLKSALND